MRKFAVMLLAAAVLAMGLGACLLVDGEPETGRAGTGQESRVSEAAHDEPTPESERPKPNDGAGGVPVWSTFAEYSWNGALLEDIQGERELGDIWWVNDEPVAELYGEEVFPDGVCLDGVFHFEFNSRQDIAELAELSGFTEEELKESPPLSCMLRNWQFCVTCQPLTGEWFTPSGWMPPENIGQANYRYHRWEPVEGHEGYEMDIIYDDERPLQVWLRWKNEEGFGFWAQLPGYALDMFWEHEDEWFIKVNVSGAESGGDSIE